jgi:hypothetical protein
MNAPFASLQSDARTTLLDVFLDINGWLVADPEMLLYDAMIAISSRSLDKTGLAELLRLAQPDPTPDA